MEIDGRSILVALNMTPEPATAEVPTPNPADHARTARRFQPWALGRCSGVGFGLSGMSHAGSERRRFALVRCEFRGDSYDQTAVVELVYASASRRSIGGSASQDLSRVSYRKLARAYADFFNRAVESR